MAEKLSKKGKYILISFILIVGIMCIVFLVLSYMGWSPFNPPEHKADEGDIRIACVGDSITYGALVKGWFTNTYPEKLGNMLGEGYTVNNYGRSGANAQSDSDQPYIKEKVYGKSLAFNPNIVIIMLGTNDSKEFNWKNKQVYKDEYSELIDNYLALKSVEKIYIMTPPPAYEVNGKVGYNIDADRVKNEINQAVKELAEEKGLSLIDLYTVFNGKEELFADGVHPNKEGALLLAQTVYEHII